MSNKKKIVIVTFFITFFTTLQNNTVSAQVTPYVPSIEETNAYNICSTYVNDIESLTLANKTYKQQKKVYTDFVKDYNHGNCGEIQTQSKLDSNGNITLYDPFAKKVIYHGVPELDPKVFSSYQLNLKKIQLKTKIINQFILKDFKATPSKNILNTFNNLVKFKFLANNSLQKEEIRLKKIVNNLHISTFQKEHKSPNFTTTQYYLLGTSFFSIITIGFFSIKKILRKQH